MSQYTLQPCKLRATRFVETADESVQLSRRELITKFAVSENRIMALRNIMSLRAGTYIGLAKHPNNGKPASFFLWRPDMTGDIGFKLRKDPSFSARLLEVFRVEHVEWDRSIQEM